MSKEKNQPWEVVDQAEVARATEARNAKREKAAAAAESLRQLKPGEAIRITLPEDRLEDRRSGYETDILRGWWGTKMRKVTQEEGAVRAFASITSSDGKFFFIQRLPKSS